MAIARKIQSVRKRSRNERRRGAADFDEDISELPPSDHMNVAADYLGSARL